MIAPRVLVAALAALLASAAFACAPTSRGSAAPAPAIASPGASAGSSSGASAGPSSGSTSGSSSGLPATVATGRLETVQGLRLLRDASTGALTELQGAGGAEVLDRLGTADHPVRVAGGLAAPSAAAASAGATRGIDVATSSFTDGIYDERALAPGLTWRRLDRGRLFGATETINVLEVDITRPGLRVRPVERPAGMTQGRVTSVIARSVSGRAAVNGGYFDGSHAPTGLLRVDGRLVARNPGTRPPRAALGFFASGGAAIDWIAPQDDWAATRDAMGAGPNLVTGGRPDVTRAQEGMLSSLESRHPRTAVGLRRTGEVVLLTADGRSAAGAGLTLAELARILIVHGCERAMNLDGGGSTTMWIEGEPDDGVVSYPSDDGNADHWGERRVANALVVTTP